MLDVDLLLKMMDKLVDYCRLGDFFMECSICTCVGIFRYCTSDDGSLEHLCRSAIDFLSAV